MSNIPKEQLTADLPTKSAKIRALNSAGYSRSEIADFLGIRYQHVRNVLVNDARVAGAPSTDNLTIAELKRRKLLVKDEIARLRLDTPGGVQLMNVRVGPDGRIVIPSPFREVLRLKEGDTLLASLADGEIHLLTIPAAVRKAQAIVRKFVPEGVSLVDELLAERRREVEREGSDA